MKRILFVDDEQNVLDALRCRLRGYRTRWEMVFAPGGAEAIREIEARPFDVVVSDVQMPRVDGVAVLTWVRDHSPSTARIVLSGAMESDVARRLSTIAHQFLSKPSEPARLESVIDRACRLQEMLRDPELRALLTGIGQLPALPDRYLELTDKLQDPDASLNEVAEIVRGDIAIAAKILQVVNSSFFGLPISVQDIDAAVRYLGAEVIKSLILMIEVFQPAKGCVVPGGWQPDRIQRHSMATARVARRLTVDAKATAHTQQNAFIGGMLHDIGLLVMATRIPERLAKTLEASRKQGLPFEAVESDVFGITHADIGAYLVGMWGLPMPIVESVAFHHRTKDLAPRELDALGAVQLAAALVDEIDGDDDSGPHATRTQTAADCAESLKMTGALSAWRALAAEEMSGNEAARSCR